MTTGPRTSDRAEHRALVPHVVPRTPRGAVLVLHGGRSEALGPPPRVNMPKLRMQPFRIAISRAVRDEDVLVAGVRYRHRGWNGTSAHPVRDVLEAVDAVRDLAPEAPIVLVGHSMGGRAALAAAGHPLVRGVVGLAPWCPPGEPVEHLADRDVVLLHDEADRVTSARSSWDLVRRARRAGARACGVAMPEGGHPMLRDAGSWHRLAGATAAGLLGVAPLPPLVSAALDGGDAGYVVALGGN